MIAIAVIVMGIKGREYLLELKEDDDERCKYFLKGIIISGFYEIGWASSLQ
jgi:hypothetical protein